MPWIDVEKDTGAYVKALIEAPAPTQILGVSEWLTCREWLTLWSSITGVPSRFEAADPAQLNVDNDPTGLTHGFLQTAQFMADFGFTGGDTDVLMPEDVSTGQLFFKTCADYRRSLIRRASRFLAPRLLTIS